MATEMKQFLALLLLATCACTVYGQRNFCTKGLSAFQVFVRHRGCRGPNPLNTIRQFINLVANRPTVNNLDYVFTNYCSTVLPNAVQCFERIVQSCSAEQEQVLKTVARQTGFVCQPNSTSVNPVFEYVLSQLSDDDLVDENGECNDINMRRLHERCFDQSLASVGLTRRTLHLLRNYDIDQVLPLLQTYMDTEFQCLVSRVREAAGCRQWRGTAIQALMRNVFPPKLGRQMNFSRAELARMFDWPTPTALNIIDGLL